MKSLLDFKTIVEEEKSDYSKFDMLVRAGLANKAQIQRIHKILDKMQEEKPVFNNADRMILQNMFNKMVDLISNNKQIFTQARRAVKEDVDTIEEESLNESGDTKDTPYILLLKRKAIRIYPDGTKVALYHNKQLDKYFSVPYGPGVDAAIQAEETELDEAVMDTLHKIVNDKQAKPVKFASGHTRKVDHFTASAITQVHSALNDDNKKKFADMVHKSPEHFMKASDFAFKRAK
jgi:CRISPR/Cas system-associated protein Csx1